jgi:hypothetical protein
MRRNAKRAVWRERNKKRQPQLPSITRAPFGCAIQVPIYAST